MAAAPKTPAKTSTVKIDANGKPTQWLRGAVPDSVPQTVQGGEFIAALMATQAADEAITVVDDCANVVDAFGCNGSSGSSGGGRRRSRKELEAQVYGATVRQANSQLSGQKQMTVVKCKAHVLDDLSDEQAALLSREEMTPPTDMQKRHCAYLTVRTLA